MSATVDALVQHDQGYVLAPAGYGKTEAIAQAVAADQGRRHLILTHTHAGVHALTNRLRSYGVSTRSARVDTIASFALRWAASYPGTSGLPSAEPETTQEWIGTYDAALRILARNEFVRAVRASYDSVLVDEYQDCTRRQHALVLALREVLPVKILGDPLQGIFYFSASDGDAIVDWDTDVLPTFDPLPPLDTPHRWRTSSPLLAEWLIDARTRLIAGAELDLQASAVSIEVDQQGAQVSVCRRVAAKGGTVAALIDLANRAHHTTRNLGGQYGCMEPMNSKDLFEAAKAVGGASGTARAAAVIAFAEKCMSHTGQYLRTGRRRFASGSTARPRQGAANYEAILALNKVVETEGPEAIVEALDAIRGLPDVRVYRYELLHEFRRAVHHWQRSPWESLAACAWQVREMTRRRGRAPMQLSVTRPVLAKGLEFDHAILLDGGAFTDPRDLYVAITRGSRSLTIIGRPPVLPAPQGDVYSVGS